MDEESIRQLKVAELRTELQKLSLPTSGRKEELATRLIEALSPQTNGSDLSSKEKESKDKTSKSISSNNVAQQPATNTSSEAERVAARAQRFNSPSHDPETERRKQRAERFGSIEDEDLFAEERLRARQERFGCTTSSLLQRDDFETQKIKRMQRFGLSSQ